MAGGCVCRASAMVAKKKAKMPGVKKSVPWPAIEAALAVSH